MKQRIVFFGSGDYTVPIVNLLTKHGLLLTVTTEREDGLVKYLKQVRLPFLTSDLKDAETRRTIRELNPSLGILASYGALVPEKVIELFPYGILNVHPSLLPKYRGSSPIQTTIIKGDKQTGITIMKLDRDLDHGPIMAQEKFELNGTETTQELKRELFEKGAEMIEELLGRIEKGETLPEKEQDHKKATFTEKIEKKDGEISLKKIPNPDKLDRMIRAYYPWPTVFFKAELTGKVKLIKLLPNGKIQVEGKRVMSFKDFINGYQKEGKITLQRLGLVQ